MKTWVKWGIGGVILAAVIALAVTLAIVTFSGAAVLAVPVLGVGIGDIIGNKFKNDSDRREWYAKETLSNGWSRSTLNMHIKSELYERQSNKAEKISNYKQILSVPHSDLAHEMLKNPYNFDFLTISKGAQEREIEKELITHVRDFLIELGTGFSFVGSQVPIEVDGETYY